MVSQEVIDYSQKLLNEGYSFDQIKETLLNNGYTEQTIAELKTQLNIKSEPVKSQKVSIFKIFTHPKEYFTNLKPSANFKSSISIFLILGLISGLLSAISTVITFYIMRSYAGASPGLLSLYGGSMTTVQLVMKIILDIVRGLIGSLVGAFIYTGILFLFLKLFKGKGKFVELFHAYSHYSIATILLAVSGAIFSFGLSFLGIILPPSLRIISSILTIGLLLFLVIYSLYLLSVMIKVVGELSTFKSILVWLIPTLILVAIVIIITMVFIGTIFSFTRFYGL